MQGLIAKKVGMTSVFNEEGNNIPCTVIEAGPCVVTQIKPKRKMAMRPSRLGSKRRGRKGPQKL